MRSGIRNNRLLALSALSLWTAVLYGTLGVDFTGARRLVEFERRIQPSGGGSEEHLKLKPDWYLLKISHKGWTRWRGEVEFNDRNMKPFQVRRRREGVTAYFQIPANQVRADNVLRIKYGSTVPEETKLTIRNYRHSSVSNCVITLYRPKLADLLEFSPVRCTLAFSAAAIFFAVVLYGIGSPKNLVIHMIVVLYVILSGLVVFNFVPLSRFVVFISADYFHFWGLVLGVVAAAACVSNAAADRIRRYTGLEPGEATILTLVSLITPSYMLHSILRQPCLYPIETFDEAAHTYTEVPLVQGALLRGHILKMNFFNNFGTPLLGDPINNAFALHAWVYLLFKPYIAMTINEVMFSILTFWVLFFFYRRRNLSFWASILAGILTLTAPSFFWFLQHHPHQGVLFYFTCILLLMDIAREGAGWGRYLLLHLGFMAFFLGSGLMGIFLGVPFLLVFALILAGRDARLFGRIFVLPLISALLLVHPHLLYFLRIAPLTARAHFDLGAVKHYSFAELVKGCAFLRGIRGYHTDFSINYSLPVVVFAVLGLATFRSWKKDLDLRLSVVLGLVPTLLVVVLLRFKWIHSSLPLAKSADMTRVLWFSTVFLMIPLGRMFDRMRCGRLSGRVAGYMLAVAGPALLAAGVAVDFGRSFPEMVIGVFSPPLLLAAYAVLVAFRPADKKAFSLLGFFLLLSLLVPRLEVYRDILDGRHSSPEMTSYTPMEFVKHMARHYRVSTCQPKKVVDPGSSSDQKIARYGILGSAGRSIIAHGSLRAFLERKDLVSSGWLRLLYFFKARPPAELARFGIRYLVSASEDSDRVASLGWRKMARSQGQVLFENPLKPSPFYVLGDGEIEFLHDYTISDDRIEITVPTVGRGCELLATFVTWPGWKAELDGRAVEIRQGPEHFIRLDCSGGGKLVLEFEPYSDLYIAASGAASLLFAGACCWWRGGAVAERTGGLSVLTTAADEISL